MPDKSFYEKLIEDARAGCDPEVRRLLDRADRPTAPRLVSEALGLSPLTPPEQQAVEGSEKLKQYRQRIGAAVAEALASIEDRKRRQEGRVAQPTAVIVATLPESDEALAGLVRAPLEDVVGRASPGTTNRQIMDRMRAQLIGSARLAPEARLRLAEVAAREYRQLLLRRATERRGAGQSGASTVVGSAGATTVEDCDRRPEVVLEREERLRRLWDSDGADRQLAHFYELAVFAGLEAGEVSDLTGLEPDEVEQELRFAVETVHGGSAA